MCRHLGFYNDQENISLKLAIMRIFLNLLFLGIILLYWQPYLVGMCLRLLRPRAFCGANLIVFSFFMNPNCFLIWNVRGLNDRSKRDTVKSLVLDVKSSLVCLQETNLSIVSAYDVMSILGAGFSGYVFCPASGTSGDIQVAWCDGVFLQVDPW